MKNCLWGTIIFTTVVKEGFNIVATSFHGDGGAMITEEYANANLSKAALKRGILHDGYYYYGDIEIPLYETPECWREVFPGSLNVGAMLLKHLTKYYTDYLAEVSTITFNKEKVEV